MPHRRRAPTGQYGLSWAGVSAPLGQTAETAENPSKSLRGLTSASPWGGSVTGEGLTWMAAPRGSATEHTLQRPAAPVKRGVRRAENTPPTVPRGGIPAYFPRAFPGTVGNHDTQTPMTAPTFEPPESSSPASVPPPHRLHGTVLLCGTHEPLEIEETEDACFRGAMALWARAGERTWLRLSGDSGEVEYPCVVKRCRRQAAGTGGARARYIWTLQPLGKPYPV